MKNKWNKQVVLDTILCIMIIVLIGILCIQQLYPKKEVINKIYDVKVSSTDNFVLLGDSITDFYPVEELYDDLPVVNSGVAGNTTTDILENLHDRVAIYNPTKVFLLIGTNDIREDKKPEEIVNNIKKIVKKIHKMRPQTKIYIESLYPINNTDQEPVDLDMVGNRTNKIIQNINKKLKKYCDQEEITYIDLYQELIDDEGNLGLKFTTDGLHLSNLGYLKVTKTLLSYMQE